MELMKLKRYASALLLVFGVTILCCCNAWIMPLRSIASTPRRTSIQTNVPIRRHRSYTNMIGTGFSFEDGEQILVSVQKPFGIVLEQGNEDRSDDGRIVVTEVDPNRSAEKTGVREGDVLVAVQNASTVSADLGQVLDFIATKCPREVNLRFQRME
jgi:hypothetical protein